jgi:hypothetical protein
MTAFIKRIAALLCIILTLQFFQPLIGSAYAANSDDETKSDQQSNIETESPTLPIKKIRAVTKDRILYITIGVPGLLALGTNGSALFRYIALPEEVSLIGISGNYIYLPDRSDSMYQ